MVCPANSVKAISEDRQGRIWIGTDVGLDVIDQAKITSMQAVLGVSGPTVIRLIHEDRAGRCGWRPTRTDYFCLTHMRVRRFGLNEGLPSAQVTAIYEDERGVIWLGTTGGLAVWRDGQITSLAGSAVALRETSFTSARGQAAQHVADFEQRIDVRFTRRLWMRSRAENRSRPIFTPMMYRMGCAPQNLTVAIPLLAASRRMADSGSRTFVAFSWSIRRIFEQTRFRRP